MSEQVGVEVEPAARRCCGGAMRTKSWAQMSPVERTVAVVLATVQVALAVTAWVDLARRPAAQVNGPKPAWALAIAVNFVGPVVYFLKGRRPA